MICFSVSFLSLFLEELLLLLLLELELPLDPELDPLELLLPDEPELLELLDDEEDLRDTGRLGPDPFGTGLVAGFFGEPFFTYETGWTFFGEGDF